MITKTEREIKQLCKSTGSGSGGGIVGSLINGDSKEIKFYELLYNPMKIMFWKEGMISK